MPDMGILNPETLTLTSRPNHCKALTFNNDPSINPEIDRVHDSRTGLLKIRVTMSSSSANGGNKKVNGDKCLEDYVRDWKDRMITNGVPENRCFLPFLAGSPRLVECRACLNHVYPGDEVSCCVRSCRGIYHLACAKEKFRHSVLKKFKCPHHACFLCNQKPLWRCVKCEVASHDKCAAWPEKIIHLSERSGWAVCWRHPKDWRLEKHAAPADTFQDIFSRLPLPYIEEEFRIESILKDSPNDKMEPPPYVHIRRNVYLVKKKRDACTDIGCGCRSTCSDDCVCRVQCISCSKACGCSEACANRPFRKEKKIKLVMTELCGWGVEAAEPINKGEFVIEYVGEVVDDAACTQRLWDMKDKNVKNFYMCEISKDFTIDATFKGNASRFLNHSCDPNCKLEKWQVEGEIRVGVFAARSIEVGEPLTYDYRFVQFGPEVKCHCGAANCQGYLGAKRKINLDILDSKKRMYLASLCWGSKRRRTWSTGLDITSV